MPLYDQIGAGYDATRRADPYIVQRLICHLNAHPEGVYLDLACGTGNYTTALADAGVHMHGLDQSGGMIESARAKCSSVTWCVGDTEALPYSDRTFSGAICTLAIHHFPALLSAFQQVHGVLNSGRFVLFTSTPEQMTGYWRLIRCH